MKDFAADAEGFHRAFSIVPPSLVMDRSVVHEIMVTKRHVRGGCRYEFALRWRMVGDRLAMRLEMYDEALSALAEWADLFAWLSTAYAPADHGRLVDAPTVERIADGLRDLGFDDVSRPA